MDGAQQPSTHGRRRSIPPTTASATSTIPRSAAPRRARISPAGCEWKVAGPETTQDFSAVCYYFARELQKTVDVPQGLINASWGGTRIETWLSAQALRQLGGNDAMLALLGEYARRPRDGRAHWGRELAAVVDGAAGDPRHGALAAGNGTRVNGNRRRPSSELGKLERARAGRATTAWCGIART